MRHKNNDILLMIAIGDAYAAAVEFIEKSPDIMKEHVSRALDFDSYLQHPYHNDLVPGAYTDDTEMSVANARVLINYDYPFTRLQFAQAYLNEFIRGNMRRGYAGGFHKFLSEISDGKEFLDKINSNSDKNGAAMRSVPFGVMCSIDEMLNAVTMQAEITHNTHAGCFSARAIALMSHFALYRTEDLSGLENFVMAYLPLEDAKKYGDIFYEPWDNGPVTKRDNYPISVTTVHAVYHLLKKYNSYLDIMKRLIVWRGDTDSVAALAWGIFSARDSGDYDIPAFMYQELESGSDKTGVKYLSRIGEELMNKYA